MTLRVKLELAAAAVVLIGLVVGFRMWLDEHDNRLKAESAIAAQQQAQAQISTQMKALADQQAQFQAEQDQKLVAMQAQFSKSNTPAEIAALVAQIMGLKQTPVIVTPAPTPDNPHPAPVAEVPVTDAPAIKAYVEKCQECDLRLQTATEQLAAGAQREDLLTQASQSKDKEIATLKTAVKGGSVLHRVGQAGKWLLYGAAGAAVLMCGSGHCK